ncbi:MAG: hypothetical protein WC803_05755 [Sphingomonas sp.]|jgi:hypothetical protein
MKRLPFFGLSGSFFTKAGPRRPEAAPLVDPVDHDSAMQQIQGGGALNAALAPLAISSGPAANFVKKWLGRRGAFVQSDQ